MTGSPAQHETYVVHTDRAALRRTLGVPMILYAALTVAFLILIIATARTTDGSLLMLVAFSVCLIAQIFNLTYFAYVSGGRLAISEPLVLTWSGFLMHTPAGRLALPWEAVTDTRIRSRGTATMIVLQLHPNASPASPGVRSDVSNRYWRRMQRLGGPMIGSKGIKERVDEIAGAIEHFSQGRVRVHS